MLFVIDGITFKSENQYPLIIVL